MASTRVSALTETKVAIIAPTKAPIVVATSRNIPIRRFVKPSLIYADAAPQEVAITDTSEAPTAYRMSTPNTEVKRGTMTTPPPKPVSDPKKPAVNEPIQTSKENSRMFNVPC